MQNSKELNQEEDRNISSSNNEEMPKPFNNLEFSFSTLEQQFHDDNEENESENDDNDYQSEGDRNESYEKYNGYNGWSDEAIDEAFEGDPEATWNVD